MATIQVVAFANVVSKKAQLAACATPNIVSGQNLQITGNVRNQAGVFSARGDVSVTASSLFNTSYRDTVRRASTDYISRDRTCVDADFCGFANEREQRYTFEDFRDRGPAPGNTTLTGKILGGGDVSIIATTSSSSGTIAAGSSQTLAPQITDLSAGGANLPALQLTADPGAVTIADLVAVPDVTLAGSVANLTGVQPQVSATPSIATLIGQGQSTFDETDPGFADYASFLTAIYTSDLQLLQRQSNVVVQQEITSDPGPSFSFGDRTLSLQDLVDLYDGAAGVQVPERLLLTSELLTLALQGNSAAQPELAPVSPRGPPSGNLSITAFSIIGSGGQFTANGGNVTLEALGPISLSGTALDGIDIRIVAGTDFTGRGLLINAVNDLSMTAVQGDVELLEIVEDHQTFARRGTGIETGTRVTQTALNVGGDLTIQSGRDTILSAVTAQVGGDTTLTAGRDLSILAAQEFFEEKGRSGSKRYEKTAVMSIVSDLNTSGGLIATAGRDATLVGAQIAAGRNTSITAGRDLVLAAAQDVEQGSSRSKKSGFLSSKTTTESYLNITNRGVSITSGGDIALQADTGDLTTAGSRFNARGGDVALTATQGDVLVSSYTDTRQRSKTVKKSILGGLLGGTDHKTRIDQIGSGTDALAALDLSVVSGGNTTLIGAQLEAGQRLRIRTGGDLSVQGALSSTRKDRYSNNSGLVVSTTITERSFREAVALTSLLAGGALDLDVGGRTELVLYALEGTDAPRPEDVYPQELLALQGLSLLNQELADEYFYEKETTLSPAFKALVAVALSSTGVGAQMGASLLGTVSPGAVSTAFTVNASGIVSVAQGSALGAASTAFASSLALDTLDAVVSGNFDVADILESAVFSGATAGLTSGINIEDLGIELGRSGGDIIAGFGSGQFTIEGLLDSTLDGVITSGLSSAVYGTDFGEGLLSSVVTYVADGIAGAAIEEVSGPLGHDVFSVEKLAAKATINCIAAETKGASCSAGALGSLVTEFAVSNGKMLGADDLASYRKRLELVAAVAGYFASGGGPENVFATADAALLDYDNNFLPLIIAAAVAAYTAYEGGGNPVEGLRVLGRGESALQVLAAQGFEETLAFSSREFPELTAATLEAAEAAGELANLGFSYVDEATGNTVSGTWNELPPETRDLIKGGAVFVSIVVPAGAGPKIAAKLRVRATNRTVPRVDTSELISGIPPSRRGAGTYRLGNFDDHAGHGLNARVTRGGELSLSIAANGSRTAELGSGADMFNSLMRRLDTDGVQVNSIRSEWVPGGRSTNYNQYVDGINSGLTPSQAAANTWTGQRAAEHGFTNITVNSTDGVVSFSFGRP
ncbi:MAG: hemagglutinin repeat-containing protein [Pseudomonadota bacterium]